jgi:chemotaxis protein methyltransferase CheR
MMSTQTISDLRAFIHRETGIHLDAGKEAMICSRLERRVRTLGLPSLDAYIQFVKSDDGRERLEMIDVLTTNHTAFFRDPHHFQFLRQWLVAERKRGKTKFRLWCAASSSGEEPYSLAMTFLEAGIQAPTCDAKILCTDLSLTMLRKASEGVYAQERFQGFDSGRLKSFFAPMPTATGIGYAVQPTLKSLLSFNRLNLSQIPFPMKGPMDIIFCRNVFIYFQAELIRKIVLEFARLIPRGGYLVVGSSESLAQQSDIPFKTVGNSIYQRL